MVRTTMNHVPSGPAVAVHSDRSETWVERYLAVRAETERLAEPLSAEDQTAQSMPETSPTKWHRAHVTWFFETFVLQRFLERYRPVDRHYAVLFNSYYESVGAQHPRPQRGLVTRPGAAEVTEYRRTVDDAMTSLLDDDDAFARGGDELAALVELGLHHEQQHQELLLMDIKHLLSLNPLRPAYRSTQPAAGSNGVGAAAPLTWSAHPGGLVEIGHDPGSDAGFAYDNEGPRHRVWLEPFELADRLVSVAEWCEFIDDGGYRRPELWLSDGWAAVQTGGWDSPLYWSSAEGGGPSRRVFTLEGERLADPAEPVCHLSHYEADAYARWAGARLATEFEWEAAVDRAGGHIGHHGPGLHPRPGGGGRGLGQVGSDVWEWTSSAYLPYPGFVPASGAVGEYNGKFMSAQMVLRGGARITPVGHTRVTYRNFFPASARWVMSGLRLAR